MKKVFISYRRDDARYQADRIYKALTQLLSRDRVFMDIDSIKPGDDFVEILEGWVGRCDILLALIGTGWINATDPKTGTTRLDNENDFVRIEVREALKRGIPVVPVMLDGASVPRPEELPDDLKKLVRRHAQFVEFRTFDADVASLIKRLELGAAPKLAPVESAKDRYRAEGRIKLDAAIAHNAPEGWFLPGAGKTEWFKDFEGGPEMVVVPAGTFTMGSPEDEPERDVLGEDREGPQHRVTIPQAFAAGRFAVTRGQFAAFVAAAGHKMDGGAYVWNGKEWKLDPKKSWRDPGFAQDDSHPIVCVNWNDAKAYIAWLNGKIVGKPYRLLSEAEWEYVCRAGSPGPFWWGASITPEQANYDGNYVYQGGGSKGEYRAKTVPVESFQPNPWCLYQVHGNVWEWCEDCWVDNYRDAPTDGSACTTGDRNVRALRGGSLSSVPRVLRAACRFGSGTSYRGSGVGFRLARML